jgi:alcohol dehydrogenase YqhD (iron-dependent ADH family)
MNNFSFQNPTKILFGRGMQAKAGAECARFGKKVLVHYGSERVRQNGLLGEVEASLTAAGVSFLELGGVQPNPRLSLVHQGIDLCRKKKVDLILAVGGGSVIDSAKAIAAGVPYAGDVWDFYCGKAVPEKALPVASVLTIPAAGSEASNSSVITREKDSRKYGLTASCLYPAFSILNPELAFSLPAYQVACGATDILSHLMERYFTSVRPVRLTDGLIEATMRTIVANVPKVLANPKDYDSWAEVMWAGCVAHNNLLDTGRIGDWASHGIEHELSAKYDVAHGAGLAVVFPAWMRYVYRHDMARFNRFAVEVWGVRADYFDPEATALAGIAALKGFLISIGMPANFAELGAREEDIPEMARLATGGGKWTLGNFVKLDDKAVEAIFRLAAE